MFVPREDKSKTTVVEKKRKEAGSFMDAEILRHPLSQRRCRFLKINDYQPASCRKNHHISQLREPRLISSIVHTLLCSHFQKQSQSLSCWISHPNHDWLNLLIKCVINNMVNTIKKNILIKNILKYFFIFFIYLFLISSLQNNKRNF
jgi:hypothetical protein